MEFYTSELRKYRDQAREMAMKAASEKATALSQAAGRHWLRSEYQRELVVIFQWLELGYGANNQNLWTQNVAQNAARLAGKHHLATIAPSVRTHFHSSGGERDVCVEIKGRQVNT